jgi:hypothetical protein
MTGAPTTGMARFTRAGFFDRVASFNSMFKTELGSA